MKVTYLDNMPKKVKERTPRGTYEAILLEVLNTGKIAKISFEQDVRLESKRAAIYHAIRKLDLKGKIGLYVDHDEKCIYVIPVQK